MTSGSLREWGTTQKQTEDKTMTEATKTTEEQPTNLELDTMFTAMWGPEFAAKFVYGPNSPEAAKSLKDRTEGE